MLEFALPAGGLRGVTLTGALCALKERKMIPNVVTGVSAGAYAAYMTYGGLHQKQVVKWFGISRDHFCSRSGVSRFLPPYDNDGNHVVKISKAYLIDPKKFRRAGLKSFFVGYTKLPHFQFVIEDIMNQEDTIAAYKSIIRSSHVPFITNYGLHCSGFIDGGFRYLYFCSPEPCKEKWLFSFEQYSMIHQHSRQFTRKIILKTNIRHFTRATDEELVEGFERGYDQGWKITI